MEINNQWISEMTDREKVHMDNPAESEKRLPMLLPVVLMVMMISNPSQLLLRIY